MPPKLRFITYLSPGVPVEYFETVKHYLEEVLQRDAILIYESRSSGPVPGKQDPFTADEVDIGFMCSTPYLRLCEDGNAHIKLIEAGAVHTHPNGDGRPIYFSDIIINSVDKEKYSRFEDLKGHSWAYNDDMSLSGNFSVLAYLKRMGTNASFFGNVIKSGGHLKSIRLVLDKVVDGAAIDSTTLSYFLKTMPELRDEITTIQSFGPLPIQPIVANKRLPADLIADITQALLDMHKHPKWLSRLSEFQVERFVPIDHQHYDKETELKELVKGQTILPAYY